jgi:hypothetical protein
MPTLSKHYALLDFYPGDPESTPIAPISCTVTVDETFAPYVTATVVVPTNVMPYSPDPRFPVFLGLKLQQDFGDLLFIYKITEDHGGNMAALTAAFEGDVYRVTREYTSPWNIFEPGLPISTVTAEYGGDISDLTAADLATVWRMSDFLHEEGTFNPAPSTVFDGYLMLRAIEKDYITGESTLELTSHEAILLDSVGYPSDLIFSYTSLRDIINLILGETIGGLTELQPGAADFTYDPPYGLIWPPEKTAWDYLYELVTSAGLVLYCDEKGDWYLEYSMAVSGALVLKDDDNITTLSSRIDRNSPNFFDYAIVEYRNTGALPVYQSFGISGFDISKDRYFLFENLEYPGGNPAQELVLRGTTRGETYEVEAISNYNARPRQNMTIDVSGEPIKSAIIQSITWSLPSARMSLDIRDLQEVI